jgi:3-deoxy-D-manno-octulosonic-acid transferase
MNTLLNGLYLAAGAALSPWLLYKAATTGKYRRGLWTKLTGDVPTLPPAPRVWFHAVSVGEVHLLRPLLAEFRKHYPHFDCVISTTTDTGLIEAGKHFSDLTVFWWPLDFSWAVKRAFDRVRPNLVVLAEGEMWPNFLMTAKRRRVPVAVVNGRMSPRSFRRYRLLAPLVWRLLQCVDLFAMQNDDYAANLRALGADPARVHVTGSVKYDGVTADRDNPRSLELRRLLDVRSDDLTLVAGSTQAPEEEVALDLFRRLRSEFPSLRLILVPRQKDRFQEVAALLRRSDLPFVRRSEIQPEAPPQRPPVVLVDTIGELGAIWGLADVGFVGGSLDGKRGGQNMVEPAAYGAAVTFGPHVWNFRDIATRLVQAGGAVQVENAEQLEETVRRFLADPTLREQTGAAARAFVLSQQGATVRTVELLGHLLVEAARRVA